MRKYNFGDRVYVPTVNRTGTLEENHLDGSPDYWWVQYDTPWPSPDGGIPWVGSNWQESQFILLSQIKDGDRVLAPNGLMGIAQAFTSSSFSGTKTLCSVLFDANEEGLISGLYKKEELKLLPSVGNVFEDSEGKKLTVTRVQPDWVTFDNSFTLVYSEIARTLTKSPPAVSVGDVFENSIGDTFRITEVRDAYILAMSTKVHQWSEEYLHKHFKRCK